MVLLSPTSFPLVYSHMTLLGPHSTYTFPKSIQDLHHTPKCSDLFKTFFPVYLKRLLYPLIFLFTHFLVRFQDWTCLYCLNGKCRYLYVPLGKNSIIVLSQHTYN